MRRHVAPRGTWGPGRVCLGLFVEEHRDTGALDRLERRGGSGAMHHGSAAGLEAGRGATAFQTAQHVARMRLGSAAGPGQPARAAVALGVRSSAPGAAGG